MAEYRRAAVALWAGALASMPFPAPALGPAANHNPVQTQEIAESEAYTPVQFAVCCKFTNYYLFPSGPNFYQCCAAPPEFVVATPLTSGSSAAGQEAQRVNLPSTVTVNEKNTRVLKRGVEPSCVNLSELTPLERLLRSTRVNLGGCVEFVTYDHFPCTCETRCNDPDWLCDCPGVPPGQLPEIKPQDSLGSQPEFLGTVCTPCNTQSTCAGSEPPPSGPPA